MKNVCVMKRVELMILMSWSEPAQPGRSCSALVCTNLRLRPHPDTAWPSSQHPLSPHQSLCSVTRCQQLAPDHRVHTVDQSWYCRVLRRQLWQRTLCWLCAGEAWYIDSSKCGHSYTKHCWSSFPRWHWCRVRAEPAGRVGPSQCWQGEPGLASS